MASGTGTASETPTDARLREITRLLDPPAGQRPWSGGASPLGCLRGVTPEQAAWTPRGAKHGIWELALHLAYWKYAVRRNLEGSPSGAFPRSPSNWPSRPEPADAKAWKADRALLRDEHRRLVEVVRGMDAARLDQRAPGSGAYRYVDLLFGIVTHDVHHVGQIQVLKRLARTIDPD